MKKLQTKVEIDKEILAIINKIDSLVNEINSKSTKILNEIDLEIKNLQTEIEELERIHFSLMKLFVFIISKIEKYKKKKRYNYLKDDPKREVNALLRNELYDLKNLTDRRIYLENNLDLEIKHRLSDIIDQLEKIRTIRHSNEYKGADGEIFVIEKLSKLSDEYCLFNNLSLKLKKGVKFNRTLLKSAQIDHLVVGPSGVYVIETKNWSESYVQSVFDEGTYTPYDQIKRSSYIVYRYLNRLKYGNILQKVYYKLSEKEIKVKSIIVVINAKIPLQNKGYVEVLYPDQLIDYITKRNHTFSNEMMQAIIENIQ